LCALPADAASTAITALRATCIRAKLALRKSRRDRRPAPRREKISAETPCSAWAIAIAVRRRRRRAEF